MPITKTYRADGTLIEINGNPVGSAQAMEDLVDAEGTLTKTLRADGVLLDVNGRPWSSPQAAEDLADAIGGLTVTTDAAGNVIEINGYQWNSPAAFDALAEGLAAPAFTIDATSAKGVPVDAAEWAAVGVAAPASTWLCQEAASPLADSIGAVNLASAGAGHLYQQAVAGWSRLAVRTVDGTVGQRWINSVGAPNPLTTSVTLLAYVDMPTTSPGLVRDLLGLVNNLNVNLSSTSPARVRINCASVFASGTGTPQSAVRPVVVVYDRTNSTVKVYTDQEKITGTYNATVSSGTQVYLGGVLAAPPSAGYLYAAEWSGADAEMSDATVKTMLETLGWTIPWS
jgi:hypothetical protein